MGTLKVVKAELLTEKSAKTGNFYTMLLLTFENDYILKVFLNDDQLYILNSIAK